MDFFSYFGLEKKDRKHFTAGTRYQEFSCLVLLVPDMHQSTKACIELIRVKIIMIPGTRYPLCTAAVQVPGTYTIYMNASDVPRSLQSWVTTIRTVVLTVDVHSKDVQVVWHSL